MKKFNLRKLAFIGVAVFALWIVFEVHWRRPGALIEALCDRLEEIQSAIGEDAESLDDEGKAKLKEMQQICTKRLPID